MFKIGDKVEHIFSKTWLLVIDIDTEDGVLYCRTKELDVIELFDWEVKLIK